MNKETSKELANKESKFPFSNSDIEKWVPTYGDSKDKFKELPCKFYIKGVLRKNYTFRIYDYFFL